MSDIRSQLAALKADDVPVHGGRTLAYVYDSGLAEANRIGEEAVAAFAGSNGLDPTAFPSLLTMENAVVGKALDLLDAPAEAVGTVTSGGTESVLLAVQSARDGARSTQGFVSPKPAQHGASFHSARGLPQGRPLFRCRAPDRARRRRLPRRPSGHGAGGRCRHRALRGQCSVVRPRGDRPDHRDRSDRCRARVRCHVDACIGGWVLPWKARLGHVVRPWTFAVEGVTSISVDLHKYGYSPKGASLLLHRSAELRKSQIFASADWPGYTMLNTTMQSTKSGGPLAGAWAVLNTIGDEGYLRLTEKVLAGVATLVDAINANPVLSLVAEPDSTLVAFTTDDSCDVFTIADELHRANWWTQPQLSFAGQPANLHLTLSAATDVDDFLQALGEAVQTAVTSGPVLVDDGIREFVASLDPSALSDADFDGLLAAVGMGGANSDGSVGVPDSMAEINALLDIAEPRLRESLLSAYLDRLLRPTR
ncbi:MAG: pyridoxal-dependent decarboxylase [Marmoricola sp.]